MEILLLKNIFQKSKLSATSSLKCINGMQYPAITATKGALSSSLWKLLCAFLTESAIRKWKRFNSFQ